MIATRTTDSMAARPRARCEQPVRIGQFTPVTAVDFTLLRLWLRRARRSNDRRLQVYGKVLSGAANRAVVLLNRTSAAQNITVRWSDLGLTNANATVRDLWTRADIGSYGTGHTTSVPAGGSALLTVTGRTEAASSTCTGTSSFSGVAAGSTGIKTVDVAYTNNTSTARSATLKVNGQGATTVSFPPTGPSQGTISVQLGLSKGSANTLTFTNAPALADITVRPLPGANSTLAVGTGSGRCLDLYDNTITNGTQAELWDCNGGLNQQWTYTSRTTNGTKVVIWDCNGQSNQKWTLS